jgi:dTDP-4-amino-4,6-dideoxygalactose transaminase
MINVTKTYLPDLEIYVRELKKIWDSGWLTNNGDMSEILSEELINYLDIKSIQLVANGTLALQLAIKALDLSGEIITTPYSYVATTSSILWESCKPVFVDIDEKSYCINPGLIESSITEKTTAIIATHVYGYPCDVEAIANIANKYGLKVIYDAAHCFGVKLHGESILNHGDCSAISFHATKLFHTAEGGAVVCADNKISERIWLMKKFGHVGEEEYYDLGINAKMSELHAAMGLCILPEIDNIIQQRRLITEQYTELLSDVRIRLPSISEVVQYNYSYYPVLFTSERQMHDARKALINQNIIPRRYFHPSLNKLPYLEMDCRVECPISESISSRILCLPLYGELEIKDLHLIASTIKSSTS